LRTFWIGLDPDLQVAKLIDRVGIAAWMSDIADDAKCSPRFDAEQVDRPFPPEGNGDGTFRIRSQRLAESRCELMLAQ
jgi:hypothetical protein